MRESERERAYVCVGVCVREKKIEKKGREGEREREGERGREGESACTCV